MGRQRLFVVVLGAGAVLSLGLAGGARAEVGKDRFDTPEAVVKKYQDFQRAIDKQKAIDRAQAKLRVAGPAEKTNDRPRLLVRGVVRKTGDGSVLIGVPMEPSQLARMKVKRIARLEDAVDGTVFESFLFVGYRVGSNELVRAMGHAIGRMVDLELEVTPGDQTVVVAMKDAAP